MFRTALVCFVVIALASILLQPQPIVAPASATVPLPTPENVAVQMAAPAAPQPAPVTTTVCENGVCYQVTSMPQVSNYQVANTSYGSAGSTMVSYGSAGTSYQASSSVSYGCAGSGSTFLSRQPVRSFVRSRPLARLVSRLRCR